MARAYSENDSHYQVLGLNNSATQEEVRRAYRILARRYHPDVNPGKSSEEVFKRIAHAYQVLSDPDRRRQYDLEYEREQLKSLGKKINAYKKNAAQSNRKSATQKHAEAAWQKAHTAKSRGQQKQKLRPRKKKEEQFQTQKQKPAPQPALESIKSFTKGARDFTSKAAKFFQFDSQSAAQTPKRATRVSVIEVSVNMHDVIHGAKKTVEIVEPSGSRRVSVRIPVGVYDGSVVRMRATNNPREELVIIIRVASHPLLEIERKGLVIKVPITVKEALLGASIKVPTLEDQVILKISPASQSGTELRLKDRGLVDRDGSRGDLYYRLLIRVPENAEQPELREKVSDFDNFYSAGVRAGLPRVIGEI